MFAGVEKRHSYLNYYGGLLDDFNIKELVLQVAVDNCMDTLKVAGVQFSEAATSLTLNSSEIVQNEGIGGKTRKVRKLSKTSKTFFFSYNVESKGGHMTSL